MDPYRRYRGTAPRRLLSLVLGLAVLVLGLLGMHTLGVDHQMPGPAASHSAAAEAGDHGMRVQAHAGHRGAPVQTHADAAAATGQHLLAEPRAAGNPGVACGDGCHLEMAMAGMCVMALSAGPVLLHLAARTFRPVRGRGPTAPRALPAAHSRAAPTPSLLRLSISRT